MSSFPFQVNQDAGLSRESSLSSVVFQLHQFHVVTPVKIDENKVTYSISTIIVGGILTINAEDKHRGQALNPSSRIFNKSFNLPDNVNRERIQTTYKNGVNKLLLHKKSARNTS